ncbi:MAG: DUF2961 domain-containing protein [Candidatus Hydrogenedentales bacterium]
MSTHFRGIVCLLVPVLAAACAHHDRKDHHVFHSRVPQGWTVPLAKLGIDGTVDGLAMPRNYRVGQISSADMFEPGDAAAFRPYAFDRGAVLADIEGPGVITRLWTRKPTGHLLVFVDDMAHPILTLPFRDYFTGELELFSPGFNLFAPPFTSVSNGGYTSYVPIPFEQRARLVVLGNELDDLSYQVTYGQFPPGTPIQSFELALTNDDADYFRDWRREWDEDRMDFKYHDRDDEEIHQSSTTLWPKTSYLVVPIDGPGVITELEMSIDSAHPEILDEVWVAVYFDGQEYPGVLAPMGLFYGTGDHSEYVSLALGSEDGRMWCRFPMPFRHGVEVRVINTSDQMADFKYSVIWNPGEVGDSRYFHARYHSGMARPGDIYRVARLDGAGHFVGATIAVDNANGLAFLESDDVIVVDNDPYLRVRGTGLDDYFNGGWHLHNATGAAPLHGVVVRQAAAPSGISAYRTYVTDPVPFGQSFDFQLGHEGSGPAQYRSVAYWYEESAEPQQWLIPEMQITDAAVNVRRSVEQPVM